MLQKYKPVAVLLVATVWFFLKATSVHSGRPMDTHCREFLEKGQTVHDCVACLKFDGSDSWESAKEVQIALRGDEKQGKRTDEFSGRVIQQYQCVQYECSALLLDSDLDMESEEGKGLLTEYDMHPNQQKIRLTGRIESLPIFRRVSNASSIILRFRLLSDRTQIGAVAHHQQQSILSKALIAFIGLAVNSLELPYLLVFVPRLDVLVQSFMVFDAFNGFHIPCRKLLSFTAAITHGCLSTFHHQMPGVWLRFNIALILLLVFLSGSRYALSAIGMLMVAVQLQRSYLDTEAIWATIVITFYLVRLHRQDKQEVVNRETYDVLPQASVQDTTA